MSYLFSSSKRTSIAAAVLEQVYNGIVPEDNQAHRIPKEEAAVLSSSVWLGWRILPTSHMFYFQCILKIVHLFF